MIVTANIHMPLVRKDVHVDFHIDDPWLRQVPVLAILLLVAGGTFVLQVSRYVVVDDIGVIENPDTEPRERHQGSRQNRARRSIKTLPRNAGPLLPTLRCSTQPVQRRYDHHGYGETGPIRLEPHVARQEVAI